METEVKKIKIWNGRDWDCRGHLYVGAYSQKDAVAIANEAYRKIKGLEDRPDINPISLSEVRDYWSPGCWGISMDGVTPERGVWWSKQRTFGEEKPVRII